MAEGYDTLRGGPPDATLASPASNSRNKNRTSNESRHFLLQRRARRDSPGATNRLPGPGISRKFRFRAGGPAADSTLDVNHRASFAGGQGRLVQSPWSRQ